MSGGPRASARGPRRSGGDAPRRRRPTAADGFVVVDKPAGWTSHDVVARMRGIAGTRKVGHAGTLDPMATGVLVVGIGRATRLLTYVVGADKEYTATVRLGVATTTEDAEGDVTSAQDAAHLTRAQVEAAARTLTGDILQVPSAVSAIKVDGERAYARVRAGEQVELAARPVTVSELVVGDVREAEVAGPDGPVRVLDVDVRTVVSSGTYVRALARDLGAALGVGAHLTALRRTRVGGYLLGDARTLDELAAVPDDVPVDVMPLADAARATFPVHEVDEAQERALGYGQAIAAYPPSVTADPEVTVAAIGPTGRLVALLRLRDGKARPVLVLAAD